MEGANEHFTGSAMIGNPRAPKRLLRVWSLDHCRNESFALAVNYVWNADSLAEFERDALFESKARFAALKVRIVSRTS